MDESPDELTQALAATAIARDRAGGHVAHEREPIRRNGLFSPAVPVRFGGQGANRGTTPAAVRRLAEVDSTPFLLS